MCRYGHYAEGTGSVLKMADIDVRCYLLLNITQLYFRIPQVTALFISELTALKGLKGLKGPQQLSVQRSGVGGGGRGGGGGGA